MNVYMRYLYVLLKPITSYGIRIFVQILQGERIVKGIEKSVLNILWSIKN